MRGDNLSTKSPAKTLIPQSRLAPGALLIIFIFRDQYSISTGRKIFSILIVIDVINVFCNSRTSADSINLKLKPKM